MMDHRDTQYCPLPSSPRALGLDPPRWHRPLGCRNRTSPYLVPAPNASKGQACRAQVFPWKPGSAQSWLVPCPQGGELPWILLPAGRPLTHFQGNSPGSVPYYLGHPCSVCGRGFAPLLHHSANGKPQRRSGPRHSLPAAQELTPEGCG